MRRYRDQETTLEQVYLADLVEAVERLTDVIVERIPLAQAVVDEDPDPEPDIDDEPPPDYGPPGSGAVITEYD